MHVLKSLQIAVIVIPEQSYRIWEPLRTQAYHTDYVFDFKDDCYGLLQPR